MKANINLILVEALKGYIKPCPCCGSAEVYHKIITEKTNKDVTLMTDLSSIEETDFLREQVGCFKCGLNMTRATGCNIIKQWNTRKNLEVSN